LLKDVIERRMEVKRTRGRRMGMIDELISGRHVRGDEMKGGRQNWLAKLNTSPVRSQFRPYLAPP